MIIIKFPGFIHSNIENNKNIFRQQIYGCPSCAFEGKLYNHGSYLRNLITEESSFPISIHRVKCPICGKTHALIPDFLIPYFQHCFYTIKKCLELKYLENASYSGVAEYFHRRNTNSYFSESNILNFTRRFTENIHVVKLFFNSFLFSCTNGPLRPLNSIARLSLISGAAKQTRTIDSDIIFNAQKEVNLNI